MATTDTVIINLLIKEQGIVAAINSQKTLAKQTVELANFIDNLAEKYSVSSAQIVRAIETYNTAVSNMQVGKQIDPKIVGNYQIELDTINRLKAEQKQLNDQREAANKKKAQELEQDKALVANKEQQVDIEIQLLKIKEQEALASEKAFQASLKETPADKAFATQLEAESKATIKKENDAIKKQEAEILADKRQQLLVEIEMSKSRVVDIEQARKEAELEDARINKANQRLSIEQRTSQIMAQYGSQLLNITKMIPADQSTTLARLVPQMAAQSGLPINTLMREIQTRFNILPDTIRKSTQEIRQFQNGLVGTVKEVFNLNAIMNTAFGVGMAMLIFQLQMLVSKFFTDTIQQAKDLSNAIGKISIAEQVMSKEGIDVTGKDMLKIVSDLEKEFTNISNVDMLKATGDMALRLAGTGFTPQELKGLLEVANAAKIRNPEKTLEEIMGTVSAAAMSGQVEGVRNLGGGLSVAASDVQAYAVRIGMIKDANDKLTEEQKLHARAGVLIEQNNKTLQESLKLQDNLVNAGDRLTAKWKDLTEQAGGLVTIWNVILLILSNAFEGWSMILEKLNQAKVFSTIFNTWALGVHEIIVGVGTFLQKLTESSPVLNKLLGTTQYIAAWTKAISDYWDNIRNKINNTPTEEKLAKQDTTTGPVVSSTTTTEDNSDKIQKALNDLAEAMDTFYDRALKSEEDFQTKSAREWDDYYNEVYGDRTRFLEDWEADRNKINSDAEGEIEKSNRDHNRKKLDDEAKFQEQLRQLRERFLMNLDDALHARDARQVLRLAREYAMNKQDMINEHNLKQKEDDAQHKAEIDDIIKKRNDRLRELDIERALKLKRMDEDFKVKQAREKQDHDTEMRRLEEEKQDRLRQLANTLAEQLGLSKDGATDIYNLFNSYFGPKGSIGGVMKFGYENVVRYADAMAKKLAELLAKYRATMKEINGTSAGRAVPRSDRNDRTGDNRSRANGGLDIASSPTSLTFGDAGPEMALTVPLNKLSNLGGILSSFNSNQKSNSQLEILMTLSPDLEARIINKSLDQVENAIVNVRRSNK